jgi:hypothetical protein
MRISARIAAILLFCSSLLFAQAEGEVESIGFGGYYRPDCWVPMLVRLRPTTDAPAKLQIRVFQKDLDSDRVVTVRDISLTPALDGRGGDQWFWMYYRPRPHGLADARSDNLKTLTEQLKVTLCDARGNTIANLPLTQMTRRVDSDGARLTGAKLVLCVSEGPHQATWRAYDMMTGLAERPTFLLARLKDLPEDVRGYEMVDAIIWLGAAAPDPRRGTEEPRFRALQEYVRRGGHLVVCQGAETALTRGFESILPVTDIRIEEDRLLEPLMQMLRITGRATNVTVYPFAVGKPRPQARVEIEKVWAREEGEVRTPYLARLPLGFGCVSWVAQDLSDSAIARRLPVGWAHAWDRVLGWRNDPQGPPPLTANQVIPLQPYGMLDDRAPLVVIGDDLIRGGTMSSTTQGYILVVVAFFVVYWVVAGPGASGFLAARHKSHLNWFVYGGAAVVAAALSVGVTRLVQTQDVRADHLSLVRFSPDGSAVVESRVAVYIPRDGRHTIAIRDTQPRTTSWITPFPEHPERYTKTEFLAAREYELPIHDPAAVTDIAITVPYRSTAKSLDVRWCGSLPAPITGKVTLAPGNSPELTGVLTNQTAETLRDVFLVYTAPSPYIAAADQDRIVYIPEWAPKKMLELGRVLDRTSAKIVGSTGQAYAWPGAGKTIEGLLEPAHVRENQLRGREGWAYYFYSLGGVENRNPHLRNFVQGNLRFTLAMASLYNRLPPVQNRRNDKQYEPTRGEVVRVNSRSFDASNVVASGQLLIFAQGAGKSPLPYPLEVEGDRVTGEGVTIYQVALPLERK